MNADINSTARAFLLDALNDAAAALINVDPDGKQKFAALRGKVFCLDITAPAITLFLLPNEHGLEFARTAHAPPDVTLSGSAFAFAALARGASVTGGDNRVTVQGDAELAQALQKILGQLDLDWEELLSRHIGDTPARKLANVARGIKNWVEQSADLSRENAVDYLREEKKILVAESAMKRFDENLNRARADVDRLTQRIAEINRVLDNAPQK